MYCFSTKLFSWLMFCSFVSFTSSWIVSMVLVSCVVLDPSVFCSSFIPLWIYARYDFFWVWTVGKYWMVFTWRLISIIIYSSFLSMLSFIFKWKSLCLMPISTSSVICIKIRSLWKLLDFLIWSSMFSYSLGVNYMVFFLDADSSMSIFLDYLPGWGDLVVIIIRKRIVR